MKKRILSVVLVLSMVVSFMPIIASAYDGIKYGDYLYYQVDGTGVTIIDCDESAVSVNIPSTIDGLPVTIIGESAFWRCSKLSNIIIPNSVKTIGNEAFEDCKNLKNITLPDTMEKIGGAAFVGCSSLTSITLPYGITGLFNGKEGGLFQDCSSLKSIIIPDSVTKIWLAAFWGCSSLTSITIPKSVTEISYEAFRYCNSLKDVYYTGTKAEWEKITIYNDEYKGNDDLLNATIHYNSTTPSTIYLADKISTQITSGKLKITLNVDDNINNATVYVAFRNNGKIVDVKKATLSNLKAEVSLSNKTYTDMNIYIWNSRQQPYTYVKNIKNK
jgi:hypothetical protein